MAAPSGPDVRDAIVTPTLAPPGSATCTVTTATPKILEGVRAKGPLNFVRRLAWGATRALCVAQPLAAPAGSVHGVCEGLYKAVLREYARSACRKVRDPHHTMASLVQAAQPSLCRACCSPRSRNFKPSVGAVQQACLEALDIIAKATLQDEVALSLAEELPPECLDAEGLYLLVSMVSQSSSMPHLYDSHMLPEAWLAATPAATVTLAHCYQGLLPAVRRPAATWFQYEAA